MGRVARSGSPNWPAAHSRANSTGSATSIGSASTGATSTHSRQPTAASSAQETRDSAKLLNRIAIQSGAADRTAFAFSKQIVENRPNVATSDGARSSNTNALRTSGSCFTPHRIAAAGGASVAGEGAPAAATRQSAEDATPPPDAAAQ